MRHNPLHIVILGGNGTVGPEISTRLQAMRREYPALVVEQANAHTWQNALTEDSLLVLCVPEDAALVVAAQAEQHPINHLVVAQEQFLKPGLIAGAEFPQ